MKSLVSILTPCYNAEKYLSVLIESILKQDYPYVEVIFVNDGSLDGTKDIIFSYEQKIKEKGYAFKYIEQENTGSSGAVNNGLKSVEGDYLIWPDSDDWFYDSSVIRKMVYFLDHSSEAYTCVRVLPWYVDEVTKEKTEVNPLNIAHEDLLDDFLSWTENVWAPAGSTMVRTKTLFEVMTERSIFTSRNVGQNHQLILPVLSKGKCKTIDEHLYCILVRKGSHSRGTFDSYKKEITRWKESEEMFVFTIKVLPLSEDVKKQKIAQIKRLYKKTRLRTAKRYHKFFDFLKFLLQR